MSARSRPALERLMEKIDVRGPDECWPWKAFIGTWGYGVFWLDGKNINSSRAAYLLLVGPVAPDLVVCHSCDTPACCNPKHLWLGTQADNLADCRRKGRSKGQFADGHAPAGRHITEHLRKVMAKLHYKHGVTQTDLGHLSGFDSSSISRALREVSAE